MGLFKKAFSAVAGGVGSLLGSSGVSKLGDSVGNLFNRATGATQAWERQTAYDDPSAVMKRLLEAGLNPNLIYGNGSSAGGSARAMSGSGDFSPLAPLTNIGHGAMSIANDYQNFRLKKLDADAKEKLASQLEGTPLTIHDNRLVRDVYRATQGATGWIDRVKKRWRDYVDQPVDRKGFDPSSNAATRIMNSVDNAAKKLEQISNKNRRKFDWKNLRNRKR